MTLGQAQIQTPQEEPREEENQVSPIDSDEGGEGTSGGGDYVDVKGTPVLSDFVSHAVCEYREAEDMIRETPYLNVILGRLAKLDWYYAAELRNEIASLKYCLTGPLKKIATIDHDAVTTPYRFQGGQLALRLNREVFINRSVFYGKDRLGKTNPKYPNGMSQDIRAYSLTHEGNHRYLSHGITRRYQKLLGITNAIKDVNDGKITTRKQLWFQLDNNGIEFPKSHPSLDQNRRLIEYVLADRGKRESILRTVKNFYKYFTPSSYDFIENLYEPHKEKFELLRDQAYEWVVKDACTQENGTIFKQMLADASKYDSDRFDVDPLLLCLSVSPKGTDFYDQYLAPELSNEVQLRNKVSRLFARLSKRTVTQDGLKFEASPELLRMLTGEKSVQGRTLLAIDFPTKENLSPDFLSLAVISASILNEKGAEELEKFILTNTNLISALRVTDLVGKVALMPETRVSLEKSRVLQALPYMMQDLTQAFVDTIREYSIDKTKLNGLVSKLNASELGYVIQ